MSLESLNALLERYDLPPANELVGRKFCFETAGNQTIAACTIVSTVTGLMLVDDQVELYYGPPPTADPAWIYLSLVLYFGRGEKDEKQKWELRTRNPEPDEGEEFQSSLCFGTLTLLI